MNLTDLLSAAGGQQSLGALAGKLGIGSAETQKLVAALSPAFLGGVKKNVASENGLSGLKSALATGNHQRYLDDPSVLRDESAREDGNNILGHLFGSKEVSRHVAAEASVKTGLDTDLIKKALPLVAGLTMGAMSKKTSAGQELGSSASGGGLGSLAGLIDGDGDGVGLDDVMNIARKFF